MHTIIRTLGNEEIAMASCDNRIAADNLIQSFKKYWPAEYIVRDSEPSEELHPILSNRFFQNRTPSQDGWVLLPVQLFRASRS
jgi:hypothetical protein